MTANKEILYWQSDSSWYDFDQDSLTYTLTEHATDRAKASFAMWEEFYKDRL